MNDNKIEDKIYSYLDGRDPNILKLEEQVCELNDQLELLIPPSQYNEYMKIILKQEELRHKRDFLEFVKIYKEALKEGLMLGMELDV